MIRRYDTTVSNGLDAPLEGVYITVRTAPAGVVATIYSDDGVTPKANPFISGSGGAFEYWAAEGNYTEEYRLTSGGQPRQVVAVTLTDSDSAALVSYLPAGTGAGARPLETKMREFASITDFDTPAHPVVGDNSTDCTDGIQLARDAQMNGEIGELVIPYGIFRISDEISTPDNIITGKRVSGMDRTGAELRQMTNNKAIWKFDEIALMHSCQFDNFAMTWANAQTGNTDATGFRFAPKVGGGNIYESNFHDLFVQNCDTFMRGDPDAYFWGNSVRDIFCDTDGGFVDLDGTAGQPKVGFDNVYILGGAAGRFLFDVNAMTADYFVEVNATQALMLKDYGGGTHNIRHWALEVASYAANGTLFDCINSILNVYGSMYLNTITLTGTAAVTGFRTGPASPPGNGYLNIADVSVGVDLALAVGAKFTVYAGNDNLSTIGRIRAPWTAPNATPVCQLTDVPSGEAAESLVIKEWVDPNRTLIAGDGTSDVVLDYDSPMTILVGAVPLAADMVIRLPREGGVVGNNLFCGPRWKIVKLTNAGTAFKIDAKNYNATTTIDTILAATASGSKSIRWDRSPPNGVGVLGVYTVEPVPV